jgi:hypothetical protein
MADVPSHIRILTESFKLLSDGLLNVEEIDRLLALARGDGVIDEDEKRVLAQILELADRTPQSAAATERIREVRLELGIRAPY